MEKRRAYQVILFAGIIVMSVACRKHEVNTNRLSKVSDWKVTTLEIGGDPKTALPRWDIAPNAVEDQYNPGTWKHSDGSTAPFQWQFMYYEGTFRFNLTEFPAAENMSKAHIQCDNLSGEYMIITDKSKLYEFESITTNGYSEMPVFIRLEPQ